MKKFLELILHVYGKDDTQIMAYNIERWPREKKREKHQKKPGEQITEHL